MPAPHQIQLICEKAGLDVPSTVLEAQKPIAQGLVAIPENPVLSPSLATGSNAFKLEKEALLSKVK